MKKIVIISDTHGYTDKTIIKYCAEAVEIWHAGDWGADVNNVLEQLNKPIRGVFGNIDGTEIRSIYQETNIFIIENLKIMIRHIGGYPEKYNKETKLLLRNEKPDILICGHSHILRVLRDKIFNCLFINPGAAGTYGFHKVRTLIKCKIENGKIFDMNVVELGSRTIIEK